MADPWRFVRLVAVRTADYWGGTVFSHAPPGGGGWPRSTSRAAVTLFLLAELLVVVLCLALRPRIGADLVWLLAVLVSFSLVYCVTHVQVRFRAPAEPVVAVVVSWLVAATLAALRARRRPASEQSMGRSGGPE
jgi:predicted anti-sigma-YlaC factor YlaD